MELIECTFSEYGSIFSKPYHLFNSAGFARLNEFRCKEVKYLLFKDRKYRLGLIAGVRNNMLMSPFSAPFGGFSFLSDDIRIGHIENALQLIDDYVTVHKFASVKVGLPPLFYNETFLAKLINVLYRNNYQCMPPDLDYYIDLKATSAYEDVLWDNARKNLKISRDSGLEIRICATEEERKEAYDVIVANREWKEKPMSMQYGEVMSTTEFISAAFFLVAKEGRSVAAAIVYNVNDDTAYVPWWGDRPGFADLKPMNFLAAGVFDHYIMEGRRVVHIGIATENGVPNYGLGEFKESIGCRVTPKFTFVKKY